MDRKQQVSLIFLFSNLINSDLASLQLTYGIISLAQTNEGQCESTKTRRIWTCKPLRNNNCPKPKELMENFKIR